MTGPDFYKILGVSPSAGADEIKAAYRDLVKQYHPDLFSTPAEKARATAKFRQINEAYAILVDGERRRKYDEQRLRQTPVSLKRSSPSPPRHPPKVRKKVRRRRSWLISRRWATSMIAIAITAIGFFTYVVWDSPKTMTAWTLLGNTVVEPVHSGFQLSLTGRRWTPLSRYGSRSECAEALKQSVKRDEQEGSKAIWDERNGTVGITVYLKNEAALAQEYFQAKLKQGIPQGVDLQVLKQQAAAEAKEFIRQNGITRRVRNYECRDTHLRTPETWLRRTLKQIGLVS